MPIGTFQKGEEAEYDTSNHKIPQIIISDIYVVIHGFTGFKTIVISGTQKACKPPQPPKSWTGSIGYQPSLPPFVFLYSRSSWRYCHKSFPPPVVMSMEKARTRGIWGGEDIFKKHDRECLLESIVGINVLLTVGRGRAQPCYFIAIASSHRIWTIKDWLTHMLFYFQAAPVIHAIMFIQNCQLLNRFL